MPRGHPRLGNYFISQTHIRGLLLLDITLWIQFNIDISFEFSVVSCFGLIPYYFFLLSHFLTHDPGIILQYHM